MSRPDLNLLVALDVLPTEGSAVDLETGALDATTSPELRAVAPFRDRLVGAVRAGHPLA